MRIAFDQKYFTKRWRMALPMVFSLILLAQNHTAHAFEFDPEYRSIVTSRGFQMINPAQLDSEYQSDLVTYSLQPHALLQIARGRMVRDQGHVAGSFLVSAGSLSATQFDQKLRAEVQSQLSETFHFRFLRFEDGNYEESSNHSIIELSGSLVKGTWGELSVGAYGELSRQKKEDDLGIALVHRYGFGSGGDQPTALGVIETRFFFNQIDFTRSERNDEGDRFEEGAAPYVWGAVSRYLGDGGRSSLEVFFRSETPLRWRDPAVGQTFGYRYTVAGGTWIRATTQDPNDRVTEMIRFQYDEKMTSLTQFSDGSVRSVDRKRWALEARKGFEWRDGWVFEPGAMLILREWSNELQSRAFHQNVAPYFWLHHRSGVELGYESTVFQSLGDSRLQSPTLREEAIESRLNTRYRIRFKERGDLVLALTWDVDRAEGGLFEGGQGQFVFRF